MYLDNKINLVPGVLRIKFVYNVAITQQETLNIFNQMKINVVFFFHNLNLYEIYNMTKHLNI